MTVKIDPTVWSSPNDKGFVAADSKEELIAEADVLRQELGSLLTDLREFVASLKGHGYDSQLDAHEIGEILEEIINGR